MRSRSDPGYPYGLDRPRALPDIRVIREVRRGGGFMGGEPGSRAASAPSAAPVMAARFDALLRLARHGVKGVALRTAAIAAAAVAVALAHRVHDPGVLCPTRTLTGIPCPLCGGTTVFIELGSGRPLPAVAANPVAFTGVVSVALAPLGLGGRWWA